MARLVAIVGGGGPETVLLRRELTAAAAPRGGADAATPPFVWLPVTGPDPGMSSTRLEDAQALVYLAAGRGKRGLPDLDDADTWLQRCNDIGVDQLVVVSSAQVFEPGPRHPGLVSEQAGALPASTHPVAGRWRELERMAMEAVDGRPAILTLLRPTPWPVHGGADYFSRMLHGNHAVTLPGHDPTLQLLDVTDLAAALLAALHRRRGGVFHVAPPETVSLRAALARSRVRRWPVPRLAQKPVRSLLAPLGLVAPTAQLDYIRYDWTVSAAKAQRELHVGPSDPANVRSAHDPFGMDVAYIDALGRRLLRFLHDVYWRVELDGLEHVPRDGPVVLVGVHRGFFPWDGMMILHALATRAGRYPRFLIHPGLLKFPFFFNLFRKMGGLPATQNNADYVLGRGGALGVFPEGVEGAFRLYRDAYRLGRFGRGAFVKTALLNGAPIVPFVTVGSAEASPVLAQIRSSWWRRYAMWPCIPITPTLLPLPLPLPSKWHTRFLPRIDLEVPDRAAAARDHAFVREVTRAIHEGMQAELDSIRERRPSMIAGNVFDDAPRRDAGERH